MRQTDSDIRHRMAGLMRPAAELLRSAMMLTVAAMAVLFVVSCGSGGDEPGTPGTSTPTPTPTPKTDTPILFSASQQEETEVTRAGLEQFETSFTVYGYKNMSFENNSYGDVQTVFPGYAVSYGASTAHTTTSNTNNWEYVNQQQTIKYWDWSAKAYRFFGYTGPETPEDVTYGKAISFAVDATEDAGIAAAPYISFLWFSTGNVSNYPDRQFGQPVQLVFTKPFAKVRIMFTQAYPDAVLLLDDIRFSDGVNKIIMEGTLTVTYPLTGTATQASYSPEAGDQSKQKDWFDKYYTDDDPYWFTVLPRVGQDPYTLTLKVNGEEKSAVVPAEYMDWLPGYQYTYVFKLNEQGGVEIGMVQSAFAPWTFEETDYEVYNW